MKYVVMFAVVFGLGYASHANKEQIIDAWKQAQLKERLSNEAKARNEFFKR